MLVSIKISLILIWICLLIPVQFIFIKLKTKLRFILPKLFHKGLIKILGVKLEVKGEVSKHCPLLLAANHSSYLDIIILSTIFPVCFIAKEEISEWPFFGFLAKMQNTIFINRSNFKSLESVRKLNNQIDNQFATVLFPEATTGTGKNILNFKSSLFKIFEDTDTIGLQNISLCYTHMNSMPIDNRIRAFLSWYGDMSMLGHLRSFLSISSVKVKVIINPLFNTTDLNRKEISLMSRNQIALSHFKSLKA